MSKAKAQGKAKPWWAYSRIRNRVWLGLLGLLAVAVIAGFFWLRSQDMGSPEEPEMGTSVESFALPNVVSGQTWSLNDYLGAKDIVIVSYMGWFCVGCEELLVELEAQQKQFEDRGAALAVLGSLPESADTARSEAESRGITYPLLYDAETSVTRDLGLWSDHMEMPWMGYLIIDKSGRVAASELQLDEAKGAAPKNVESILAALDGARKAGLSARKSEVNR